MIYRHKLGMWLEKCWNFKVQLCFRTRISLVAYGIRFIERLHWKRIHSLRPDYTFFNCRTNAVKNRLLFYISIFERK